MKDDFYKVENLQLVGVCKNCGRKIFNHDGEPDHYYECTLHGNEIILCDCCVKDVYEEWCQSWSGGFG